MLGSLGSSSRELEPRLTKSGHGSPFLRSSYNMLTTNMDLDENSQSLKLDMEKNAMDHVERRRQNLFKNSLHVRPVLGDNYAPHPAPGSTISHMKSLLKAPGTASSGARVKIEPRQTREKVGYEQEGPSTEYLQGDEWGLDFNEIHTPRTKWRKQFWSKRAPWAVDRRVFTGTSTYLTSLKPSARNYNSTTRWEFGRDDKLHMQNSEDIVRQIVMKLEQHCNSTFSLSRAFKFFDRDNSATIDIDEMRACLVTFSIEVTDDELGRVMMDFGAELDDQGNKVIRYKQFVSAVEQLGGKHPLKVNSGRYIKNLRATFMRDPEGRRVCTPGFKSPVGCPDSGCYYPENTPSAYQKTQGVRTTSGQPRSHSSML